MRNSSNAPIYPIGVERAVFPIGVWSTTTTCEKRSIPRIALCSPQYSVCSPRARRAAFARTSLISVDLPEPDTPVTTTNLLVGISTEIFFKLCSAAPSIVMQFALALFPDFTS